MAAKTEKTKTLFKDVDRDLAFPKLEHKILKFWEDSKAFEKLVEKNKGNKTFSFFDGPITANNPMGVHHAWGRTYKDIYQRYKAMQGYDQRYQNGFDCQGLWVEVGVEKELGLNSKREIEEYGLENFARACRARVDKFSSIQTAQSIRLGQWMDWKNSYFTFTDNNIEHIWYFLKECHKKGWLYRGNHSMPWCIRCGTSLSQHELIDSYRAMTHTSVFIKLPIIGREKEFMLVWTTTPWTLTSNVALALHPGLNYSKVKQGEEIYYLAEGTLSSLVGEYELLDTLKGEELIGYEYQGPFHNLPVQKDIVHRIIPWLDVGEDEGTGVVHIAPGCGAEDFELSKEHSLAVIVPIDEAGIYGKGFGFLTGKRVDRVAEDIFEDLRKNGFLYKLKDYEHRYPICWRCDEELVFRVVNEWFISCDQIRPRMIKAARKVKWCPEFAGKRMEDWLNNMGDWCISRKRYWGLPLPFYECECGHTTFIASVSELRERAVEGIDQLEELHRPWIDAVKIKCPKCDRVVERITEVGDCWLDAGIIPFSTLGYIGGDRTCWEKWFPADFITEMREQVRLWFYSMLFMSVTLEDTSPYKSVLIYEKVNDEHGNPMHKSAGNAIWFDEAVEKMGAEVMRWLYARQNTATNLNFGYSPGVEVQRKLLTLWNIYSFFVTYANLDKVNPLKHVVPLDQRTLMDRWLLSKINLVIRTANKELDAYNVAALIRTVEQFIDEMSNWYVRRSRKRFWKSENDIDKLSAFVTLHEALIGIIKVIAPILPFLSEEMYQNLVVSIDADAPVSLHLCEYPVVDESLIDEKLLDHMAVAMQVVSLGRAARNVARQKVRQPLSEAWIMTKQASDKDGLLRLKDQVLEELNIRKISFADSPAEFIDYDLKPNFELLGPKYGRKIKDIKRALTDLTFDEKVRIAQNGGSVRTFLDGEEIELLPEEFEIESKARDGFAVTQEGGYLVALNTEVTGNLLREGLAREFVHKIQNLRKDAQFEVSDRIRVEVEASENLMNAIVEFAEYIKHETLAVEIIDSVKNKQEAETCKINSENATISVRLNA